MIKGPAVDIPKLLGFYIAAFVLLGLVVAGVFLYRPLRLRYAIHRVEEIDAACGPLGADAEWFEEVEHSAFRGNRSASAALIDYILGRELTPGRPCSRLFEFAKQQPDLLFALLDERPSGQVLGALGTIVLSCGLKAHPKVFAGVTMPLYGADDIRVNLEIQLQSRLPEVKGVAQVTLAYLRRRFAKELADAEKKIKAAQEKK